MNNNLRLALTWFLLHSVVSNFNDILMKFLGKNISFWQVSFLRFSFAFIILIPFVFRASIKTTKLMPQLLRSLLLFIGIVSWCYGLQGVALSVATLITFMLPGIVLILARVMLKEKVPLSRYIVTLVGLLGIAISIGPTKNTFNPHSLILLLSTFTFAFLDVLNKKLIIEHETLFSMVFYSSLGTMILSSYPALSVWVPLTLKDYGLFFLLGLGANLILYFSLKAYELVDVSRLAPFRYLELVVSLLMGYLVFGEVPLSHEWCGALVVVPSMIYLSYSES